MLHCGDSVERKVYPAAQTVCSATLIVGVGLSQYTDFCNCSLASHRCKTVGRRGQLYTLLRARVGAWDGGQCRQANDAVGHTHQRGRKR